MLDLALGNLLIERERWLKGRRENFWLEGGESQVDGPSVSDQLLGGWLGGKMKKDNKAG